LQAPCAQTTADQFFELFNTDNADVRATCLKKPQPLVNSRVRDEVRMTSQIEPLWAEAYADKSLSIVWQYFGLRDGVHRTYPGSQFDNTNYNPARRFWYQRALAFRNTHTLSVPYVDAFGAGDVITLAMPIFEANAACVPINTNRRRSVLQTDTTVTSTSVVSNSTSGTAASTTQPSSLTTSGATTTTSSPITTTSTNVPTTTTTTTTTPPPPPPTSTSTSQAATTSTATSSGVTPSTTATSTPSPTPDTSNQCDRSADPILGVEGLDFQYTDLYDVFLNVTSECLDNNDEQTPCEPQDLPAGAPLCDTDCSASGSPDCRISCLVIDSSGHLVFAEAFRDVDNPGRFADTFIGKQFGPLAKQWANLDTPFLKLSADFLDWKASCDVIPDVTPAKPIKVSSASRLTSIWHSFRQRNVEQWGDDQCGAVAPPIEDIPNPEQMEEETEPVAAQRDCVEEVNVFEVNPDAIPSDTGVLQGALFSQCMVADYYVSRIGTSGNLYLVVLDNFELSDDVQCTPLEATRTESLLNHCVPTPERRRPLCASRVAVETADRCACADPKQPSHCTTKVVDCNARGDCVHGKCLCDADAVGNAGYCKAAASDTGVVSWWLLSLLVVVCQLFQ